MPPTAWAPRRNGAGAGAPAAPGEDATQFLATEDKRGRTDIRRLGTWAKAHRRPLAAGLGGSTLALVLGVGLWWLFAGPSSPRPAEEPPVATSETESHGAPAPAPAVPPVNTPPVAAETMIRLAADGSAIRFALSASDPDGDALQYSIVQAPAHGELSGTAPDLTYRPAATFAGEDRFSFQVADAGHTSEPAFVIVTGPDLRPPPAPVPPPQPELQAATTVYSLKNTAQLTIDGRTLWRQANSGSPDPGLRIEITGKAGHGRLSQPARLAIRYQPSQEFVGTDRIQYRFRLGDTVSQPGQLSFKVTQGDRPPMLRLARLDPAGYRVGDTVLLDASSSRDEKRASLSFQWSQLTGIPVRLKPANPEGSAVTFLVPSSFTTMPYPSLAFRVTITDALGHQVSQRLELPVQAESRESRRAALWGRP
ncbi:MAG: Ig-like domain-containing protein [Thermodesulfobacteriota bacterium]